MPTQYRLAYTMHGPSEDTEDMFMAEAPALPGCRAWAETPEEALEILKSLAAIFIESYLKDGDPLPDQPIEVSQMLVTV